MESVYLSIEKALWKYGRKDLNNGISVQASPWMQFTGLEVGPGESESEW